jgi:hypothetical protein
LNDFEEKHGILLPNVFREIVKQPKLGNGLFLSRNIVEFINNINNVFRFVILFGIPNS